VPAEPGATPGTGGATGLWNIRVNSPGSGDGGAGVLAAVGCATGRVGGGGGKGCGVPAATGGTPGTGVGGATGLWNIRANSSGSDDGCAKWDRRSVSVVCRLPATGAAPGTGVAGGMDCVVPAEPGATPGTGGGGATGLWNIRVNSPGSDDG